MVSAGSCWQIGSGEDFYITGQPWLANTDNHYISTVCEAFQNVKVQGLICIDRRAWDREVVMDLFNSRDQKCIFETPILEDASGDIIVWKHESSGTYTVKSAYRLL